MYISNIDFYNTSGKLIKQYLDQPVSISPLETIDYLVEDSDVIRVKGACFIIIWSSNNNIKPIFQGVMISTLRQQGISFLTNGVSISKK